MAAQAAKDYFYNQLLWNIFYGILFSTNRTTNNRPSEQRGVQRGILPYIEPKNTVLQCYSVALTALGLAKNSTSIDF